MRKIHARGAKDLSFNSYIISSCMLITLFFNRETFEKMDANVVSGSRGYHFIHRFDEKED